MKKIKILHIIKSLGRGGAEMLLPETLKLHNKSQFEFHYIYFLPWKDQMVSAIKEGGGKITCVPAKDNIRIIMRSSRVIKYCRNHQIDLIHCHLPWAGFLGRLVHARTKIPVLYTEHNMQKRYHPITKALNKITYNSQTLALGVSEDVSQSINSSIKPKIPVITLLNGVNTEEFRTDPEKGRQIREELGIPKDALVIGNLAVFRFQKRIKEWVQVFEKLASKNSNIYGIIVGFGPLEQEIKEEVAKLGIGEKVFFPGLQTNVKPYFSAMDIFMMSSSFEGLPIALLEAMSMECAVVSTDAGGIKQVIRHEKDGLICKVENWKDLEILCQELIDNPDKLADMKKSSRERAIGSFSLKKMVASLEKIYLENSKYVNSSK